MKQIHLLSPTSLPKYNVTPQIHALRRDLRGRAVSGTAPSQ